MRHRNSLSRNCLTAMLLMCCLWCVSLYAGDSDTTYGRIRIKDRAPSSGRGSSNGSDESDDDDFFGSCMGSCLSGIFDGCLDFIFNNNNDEFHDVAPPPHHTPSTVKPKPSVPEKLYAPYSDSPFHLALGMLTGGTFYSDSIAAGFIIGGNLEVNYFIHPYFGLRLASQPLVSFDDFYVDMEKEVFINDSLIGSTSFSGNRGREFILPLKAEILFVPPLESRTFFVSIGGGMSYKKERVSGTRTKTFSGGVQDETILFTQWCPNVHAGLGFFIPFAGTRSVLELGYSLFVNSNEGRYETPGDNAQCSHLVRLSFSYSIH